MVKAVEVAYVSCDLYFKNLSKIKRIRWAFKFTFFKNLYDQSWKVFDINNDIIASIFAKYIATTVLLVVTHHALSIGLFTVFSSIL